jgi:hypothetical protein
MSARPSAPSSWPLLARDITGQPSGRPGRRFPSATSHPLPGADADRRELCATASRGRDRRLVILADESFGVINERIEQQNLDVTTVLRCGSLRGAMASVAGLHDVSPGELARKVLLAAREAR